MKRIVPACWMAALALLAFGATPAAATEYNFGGRFASGGELSEPVRVAADGEHDRVYVADRTANRVRVYQQILNAPYSEHLTDITATEVPALASPVALAFDETSASLYVGLQSGTILRLSQSESPPAPPTFALDPTFASPAGITSLYLSDSTGPGRTGIAVDSEINPNTGRPDLLVADVGAKLIKRVDSSGSVIGSYDGASTGTPFTALRDLAVSKDGVLIVADAARILRLAADGTSLGELTPIANAALNVSNVAVAADTDSGEVFVTSKAAFGSAIGIKQFDEAGNPVDTLFEDPAPAFDGRATGLAVTTSEMGRLFMATVPIFAWGQTAVQFYKRFIPVLAPGASEIEVREAGQFNAHLCGIVTPNGQETSWRFGWRLKGSGTDWTYATDPEASPIAGDAGATEVCVSAQGLGANLEYEAVLEASSDGGTVSDGPVEFETLLAPPSVRTLPAAYVTGDGAVLMGEINPHNDETTYEFELTPPDGEPRELPAGGTSAGAGGDAQVITVEAEGLQPSTEYEFRLTAKNSHEEEVSGDAVSFKTGAAETDWGEARRYELVSLGRPAGRGAGVEQVGDGEGEDRVLYKATTPYPGTESSSGFPQLLAVRGEEGWSSIEASGPLDSESVWQGSGVNGSWDLSRIFVDTRAAIDPLDRNSTEPDSNHQDQGRDLYVRDPDGSLRWVSKEPGDGPRTDPATVAMAGGGPDGAAFDGSVVYFRSPRQFVAGVSGDQLYRADENGAIEFAGRRPDGTVPSDSRLANHSEKARNAVSYDGSRAVFTAGRSATNIRTALYVYKRDGEGEPATVEVSKEQGVDPLGAGHPNDVTYLDADRQMRRVFFGSSSRLTPDSGASHGDGQPALDLYVYEVDEDRLRDLTPRLDGGEDTSGTDTIPLAYRARILGVIASSEDGNYVYFVAQGRLTDDPSPTGARSVEGANNLYLLDLSGGVEAAEVSFLASLPGEDRLRLWDGTHSTRSGGVSPDGSVLAFASWGELTAMPNWGERQVYVYERERNALSCVSCRELQEESGRSLVGAEAGRTRPSRSVGGDGTVVFDSAARLVPSDGNGAKDVYEYKDGEVRLVSNARADAEGFSDTTGGISRNGTVIYFNSRQQLTGWDEDPGTMKVYAAVKGGGFPPPKASGAPCEGEDCRFDLPGPPAEIARIATTSVLEVPEPREGSQRAVVKMRARSAGRRQIGIRVRANAAGRLTVSGRYVHRKTVRLAAGRPRTVRLRLSRRGLRGLAAAGTLRFPLKAKLVTGDGRRSVTRRSIRVKG